MYLYTLHFSHCKVLGVFKPQSVRPPPHAFLSLSVCEMARRGSRRGDIWVGVAVGVCARRCRCVRD